MEVTELQVYGCFCFLCFSNRTAKIKDQASLFVQLDLDLHCLPRQVLFPHCFYKIFSSGMFNSLPNDKILNRTKLKAFADDKINVIKKLKIVLGLVENIVGKKANAGFFFSHNVFKRFLC